MTNNIYKLRIQSGLSQPDLAKELGMSFHSYRVIERDYPNINTRIETLLKIADYYGVSLDYLCGRTTEISTIPEITEKWHENFLARIDLTGQNTRTKPIELSKCRLPYPYNLLHDIFKSQSIERTSVVSEMFYKQLENQIEQLPERTRFLLRERYLLNKTFQRLSDEQDISRARIQQIIDVALKNLNKTLTPFLFDPEEKIEQLLTEIDAHQKTLKNVRKKVFDSAVNDEYGRYRVYSQLIKDVPFSVRTHNALARAKCVTVMDLLVIMSTPQFLQIRQLGAKSRNEICIWVNQQKCLNVTVNPKHQDYVFQTQNAVAMHLASINDFSILEIDSQKYVGPLNYIHQKLKEFGKLIQKTHNVSTIHLESTPKIIEKRTVTFNRDATITQYCFKRN